MVSQVGLSLKRGSRGAARAAKSLRWSLSNDWNTLLGEQISQHTAMSMSRSALESILYF